MVYADIMSFLARSKVYLPPFHFEKYHLPAQCRPRPAAPRIQEAVGSKEVIIGDGRFQ